MASRKESRIAHKVSDYLYDIEYSGLSTVPNATVRSRKKRYSDFGKDLKRAEKKWDKYHRDFWKDMKSPAVPVVNDQDKKTTLEDFEIAKEKLREIIVNAGTITPPCECHRGLVELEAPKVESNGLYTLIRRETGSMAVYNQQQHDFWVECMSVAKDKIDEAKQELSDQNVVAIVSMIVGAVLYGFISLLIR